MKTKSSLSINLPANISKLSLPVLYVTVLLILFVVASKVGWGKIKTQRMEVAKTKKNIVILEEKEQILITVKESVADDIHFFSLAIPESNPTLSIFSQIRTYILVNGLILENLKGGAEAQAKKTSHVDINFDVDGPFSPILSFLQLTESFSPIVTIEKFKLTESLGTYRASVTLRGYWADYPKKIPAITEPIKDFTDQEMEMIIKISQLIMPTFEISFPEAPSQRVNPFE